MNSSLGGQLFVVIVIVVIVIVVSIIKYYYSPEKQKKLEEQAQKEDLERLRIAIENGKLTNNVLGAIKRANTMGLTVYEITVGNYAEGISVHIEYYGRISEIPSCYKLATIDANAKDRDQTVKILIESIACAEMQRSEQELFMEVIRHKLGDELYSIGLGGSRDLPYIYSNIRRPWIKSQPQWQSSSNWK